MIGKKISSFHPDLLAWLLLLLLTSVWGSSFILIKKGLTVFNPTQVSAIRIFSASLFMVPFAYQWLKRIEKKYYFLIFISGFTGSLIPAFLFAMAQTRLDSAVTGMINSLTPVFVIIIGFVFYRQKITGIMVMGLLMAFVGTGMLMFYGSDGAHKISYFAFFVVGATMLYGMNVNLLKFNLSELNHIAISSISLVFVGPFAAIQLFLLTDFTSRFTESEGALLAVGYLSLLGIVGTSLALMIFNKLIKISTPLFSSSVTYLIPIVAVFWGLIDGENLSVMHYLSMFVIIGGVYLANKKSKS
jgi:drug/metabolite transporter (DMT)-like permease